MGGGCWKIKWGRHFREDRANQTFPGFLPLKMGKKSLEIIAHEPGVSCFYQLFQIPPLISLNSQLNTSYEKPIINRRESQKRCQSKIHEDEGLTVNAVR